MSLSEAPSVSKQVSIPGKVFVLGEYAILADRPALVATLAPRFSMSAKSGEALPIQSLHPRSPAGRLLSWAKKEGLPELSLAFEDPHQGAGGFGASTAQFALTYFHYAALAGLDSSGLGARLLYRELMQDEPLIPSGADLVAQWSGGVILFEPAQSKITSYWNKFTWQDLLVFSAADQPGRKVATHEHLQSISQSGFTSGDRAPLILSLTKVMEKVLATPPNHLLFGSVLVEYANLLHEAGLELAATYEDRQAVSSLPGVLGVKGAGALQADGLLVLLEPGSKHREEVIRFCGSRNLKLVADGLDQQPGILCAT